MKVLFAIVDGGGNIPPQLAVARALQARGVRVQVLGHQGIRARVEAAGLAFEPFTGGRHFDPTVARPLAALMAAFTRVAADRRIGQSVTEAARRHDVDAVVVDMILVAGTSEIVDSGIPTIVFVHCFYRAVQDMAASPVGWALRLRGTDPLAPEHQGLLHIVSASVPRILVSLSTCAFAGQRRMLQNILDAIAPLPVEATVTVGPAIDSAGLRVPPNAAMHAWLDHDDVLASASLVVGHGGHSTAMRALSFGVPQIVMPANPMIDQKGVGAALERVDAGILLRKHAGPKRIRAAIQSILNDSSYRDAADRLGAEIRQRDGGEVAAAAIVEYVRMSQLVES